MLLSVTICDKSIGWATGSFKVTRMTHRKSIPLYTFHRNKYGSKLQVDVVELRQIKKYLLRDPYHTLSYFDITFITEGSGDFFVNGAMYQASAGDAMFSFPGDLRYWNCEHISQGYALIFEKEFLTHFFNDSLFVEKLSFFQDTRLSSRLSLPPELWERIIGLLKEIRKEIDPENGIDQYMLRALLYEILILLRREYDRNITQVPANKGRQNSYFNTFTELICRSGIGEGRVSYYAGKLHITPDYLSDIVKNVTGISVKKYIQKWRISEAKKLLRYTDCSVSQVADRMNFEDPSYFIRFFRTHTGMTPLQYQSHGEDDI